MEELTLSEIKRLVELVEAIESKKHRDIILYAKMLELYKARKAKAKAEKEVGV